LAVVGEELYNKVSEEPLTTAPYHIYTRSHLFLLVSLSLSPQGDDELIITIITVSVAYNKFSFLGSEKAVL
jgi:hypothetical protein